MLIGWNKMLKIKIKYLIIWMLMCFLMFFLFYLLHANYCVIDRANIYLIESHSIYELQHLIFGVGVMSFLLGLGFSDNISLIGVFISAIVWEVYENLYFIEPIDTILDIVLAFVGSVVLLKIMNNEE